MASNRSSNLRPGLALAALLGAAGCASTRVESFHSPNEAMEAVANVVGTGDRVRVAEIFGQESADLLESGDEVADREDAEKVRELIREKLEFEDAGEGRKIALIGNDAWPFPIPLVEDDGQWSFDAEAGLEEIANRRVGRNELSTIETLHAYVDAQREYASVGRDQRPTCYAQKLISTPGFHDGLYWEVREGEADSPLGPLVAEASEEGYTSDDGEPSPYHGYRYRLLTRQGKSAPGGERDYVDDQRLMTRGFAMVAWPARYGSSGVMTFLVGPQGIVYQKDLGEGTESAAAKLTAFDPDESWDPTRDE